MVCSVINITQGVLSLLFQQGLIIFISIVYLIILPRGGSINNKIN